MAQKIYLRKETGLTIEEERFLRAMRLKTVKTVQELIRIETIEQKIEENQKRRQSEYKSQLY